MAMSVLLLRMLLLFPFLFLFLFLLLLYAVVSVVAAIAAAIAFFEQIGGGVANVCLSWYRRRFATKISKLIAFVAGVC